MKLLSQFLILLGFCAGSSAEIVRQPYIQLTTPDSATIVWRSTINEQPEIRLWTTVEGLQNPRAVVTAKNLQLKVRTRESAEEPLAAGNAGPAPGVIHYEARIQGLSSNRLYYYAIKSVAEPDAQHYFKTAPSVGEAADFTFWVLGDSGTGMAFQKQVHDRMREYLAKTGSRLDFALHLGDLVYPTAKNEPLSQKHFAVYAETLKNTNMWPTVGNHDSPSSKTGSSAYYDAFVLPRAGEAGGAPSGTEAYYSFDYGDVHFICLNSFDVDLSPTAPMAKWLRADLERTQAKWLIAYWHHTPYTAGSKPGHRTMQQVFLPILEAGGVDFVLAGHSHIYERSMLVDGAYEKRNDNVGVILDDRDGNPESDGPYHKSEGLNPNNGAVYVVAGHGGAPIKRSGTNVLMRRTLTEYGSVIMQRRGDMLRGQMINRYGEIRDLFAIKKSGTVEHTPIENPWTPENTGPVPKDPSVWDPSIPPSEWPGRRPPPSGFVETLGSQ